MMGNKADRRMKACGKVPVPKPKFLSPYDPKARQTAKSEAQHRPDRREG
jgi:hypothetical protein